MNVYSQKISLLFILVCAFAACKPKEKEIPMPVGEEKWVVNSRTLDNGDVLVSVCRTLAPDEVSIGMGSAALEKIMVGDIDVTIRHGNRLDTLQLLSKGIFLLDKGVSVAGSLCELQVVSRKSGKKVTSQALFTPAPLIDSLVPETIVKGRDTSCRATLQLSHDMASGPGWYLISFQKWDQKNQVQPRQRVSLSQVLENRSGLADKVLLVSSNDFVNGKWRLTRPLPYIKGNDTLVVSVSRIEKGYYDFVQAQIKSAHWLNQLLAEVILFPSNVLNGTGYFTLHRPRIQVFRMAEHVR